MSPEYVRRSDPPEKKRKEPGWICMALILRDRFTQARKSGRAGRAGVVSPVRHLPDLLASVITLRESPNDRCLEGCLSFEGSAVTGGSGDGRWLWLPERWLAVMVVFTYITMEKARGMSWMWLTAGNASQMAVIDRWYCAVEINAMAKQSWESEL